jgi:hypothetical protein
MSQNQTKPGGREAVRKEDMNTEQLMGWLSFEAQIPP